MKIDICELVLENASCGSCPWQTLCDSGKFIYGSRVWNGMEEINDAISYLTFKNRELTAQLKVNEKMLKALENKKRGAEEEKEG